MRKFLFMTAALVIGMLLNGETMAQTQTYGPGTMYGRTQQGDYGPGYMMHGYGPGWMMGPGYGYGPGMMYGYGPRGYRGERLCWKETDATRGFGYYAPCRK